MEFHKIHVSDILSAALSYTLYFFSHLVSPISTSKQSTRANSLLNPLGTDLRWMLTVMYYKYADVLIRGPCSPQQLFVFPCSRKISVLAPCFTHIFLPFPMFPNVFCRCSPVPQLKSTMFHCSQKFFMGDPLSYGLGSLDKTTLDWRSSWFV